MDINIDLVIEQLCLDIKKALVAAHNHRAHLGYHAQLDRRIRILKAMLVAASKEA